MSFRLFDGAPYGALLVDAAGRVTDANAAAAQLLARPRDELLGCEADPLLERARSAGAVEITRAPVIESPGSVVHLRDITAEREAEAVVARQDAIAAAVRDAIIEADADLRILRWNRAAERLYGWSADEVVGRPIPEVLRSELAEADAEQLLDHLDTAGHVLTVATQQTASGTKVEVEASVISLRDEHGEIAGYVSINRDVSMRRRLETRLHQTRHLEIVGRLAGGVAHDLNTLLTAIMGYTELSLGDRDLPTHIRPDLQQILAATERAGTLTRQLLAFSRAQQLSPREVDLNQLVASTVAARRRLAVRAVELVDRPAPEPVTVTVDRSQLERALLDIVANAGEAMTDAGRLTVETDHVALDLADGEVAAGRYARLRVTDTGVGMDEPTRLRACEPFFTTKPGHTGLGLSSVHGIVYQSGGHLKLDSAPGAGTTVTILLPLSPPA